MTAPNILLIMADQLAPHFTGTYGHPLVKTPHLDALAEHGVRFDAAYCHSPLCAPARFTMLAGQSVASIGAWDNAAEFLASTPTIAHYLGLAGYRTILSGKMHFIGPDQLHGFDERLTTDIYPADFAWTPNWDQADERIDRWYHNMDVLHDAGTAVATYQIDYDEEVGYAARRKLLDLARSDGEQPFFMVASFIHPHDPYVARPEWWNLYDGDEIDLPDVIEPGNLDPHTKRIRRGIEADTVGYTDDQVRNARRSYYANTSYFDHWIGKLVDTLEETDQMENTVIVITSDHGDMLGDRGTWFKMSFHERSARVPLVLSGPGVQAGTVPGACSHLDLLPTLLDIATDGRPWPTPVSNLEGRSLWAAATGGTAPADETTAEYCAEMTSHPMFMIRRGQFKYIHCDTDPPLLFDLTSDPDERINLATDPDHTTVSDDFAAEVQKRWNSDQIRTRVIESQHVRHVLYEANKTGPLVSWDYLPPNDVANSYVRNHHHWAESGPKKRYPRA
ncbi:MAG: choline-sulfatase [Acidimicrobiales bacterium]|nr:choline-sulfatase [Acidimicrobiales bacterium]